jgi:hypothetical protein
MTYDYAAVQHALTLSIEVLAILPIVVMMIDFLLFLNTQVPAMSNVPVAAVPTASVAPAAPDVVVGASEPGLGSLAELFAAGDRIDTNYDAPAQRALDLTQLTKPALLAIARERGVQVGAKTKKSLILAALAA